MLAPLPRARGLRWLAVGNGESCLRELCSHRALPAWTGLARSPGLDCAAQHHACGWLPHRAPATRVASPPAIRLAMYSRARTSSGGRGAKRINGRSLTCLDKDSGLSDYG